ncbi:MAG: cytochrome c-type biogenesis protein CcmH, partial [Oceanospirillaceae bacterium]
MIELWAAIALLLCLTSGFVLWAWWRPLPTSAVSNNRNDAVVELYRVKQMELEQELASAQINRSDYDQGLAEMQRTLLLETSDSALPLSSPNNAGGLLLLLVALVIPVAGLLTYFQLGAYSSLEQSFNLQNTRSITASATSLPPLISSLEGELEQRPNNPEGWYLLANSYMQAEQTALGIAAFEQALNYVQTGSRQHSALLGQYAQALFFDEGEFSQLVN